MITQSEPLRLIRETGGHPYLTARVLDLPSVRQSLTPDAVAGVVRHQFASLDEALRDPHFSYIQDFLAQRAEDPSVTLELYRQILNGEPVKDQVTTAHIALKQAGLIKRGAGDRLVVRNEIYRQLFTEDWAVRTSGLYPIMRAEQALLLVQHKRAVKTLPQWARQIGVPETLRLADLVIQWSQGHLPNGHQAQEYFDMSYAAWKAWVNRNRKMQSEEA